MAKDRYQRRRLLDQTDWMCLKVLQFGSFLWQVSRVYQDDVCLVFRAAGLSVQGKGRDASVGGTCLSP